MSQKPKPLEKMDQESLDRVRRLCVGYIDEVASLEDYEEPDTDWDAWIMEAAVEAVFGKGIFDWINAHIP